MNKNDLRKIIKEEIKNSLNEITSPKDYTLNNWKNIIKKDWWQLKKYTYSIMMEKIIQNLLDELEGQHNQKIWDRGEQSKIQEIAPSDFLKNKFPSTIQYDRERIGSQMQWTLKSSEKLNKNKIEEFQTSAGYAPQGYGGPFKLQEKSLPNGTFEYTWTCYSSSD